MPQGDYRSQVNDAGTSMPVGVTGYGQYQPVQQWPVQEISQTAVGRIRLWPHESTNRTPYRCPVCDGRGAVAGNFYTIGSETGSASTALTLTTGCRTCKGEGIVWGVT